MLLSIIMVLLVGFVFGERTWLEGEQPKIRSLYLPGSSQYNLRRHVMPENCMKPSSNNHRSTDSDLIHGIIIAKRQVYITSSLEDIVGRIVTESLCSSQR